MDYVNRILEYPPFTVFDILMAPMFVREFPAVGASTCFGTIYVYGNIVPVAEEDWPEIKNHREYRKREVWGRWKTDKDADGAISFRASSAGARWLCVADNGSGRPEIEKVSVERKYEVVEGWGALVCWTEEDTILVDDQQVVTSQLVMPRETSFVVSGTCDLLLFRG